MLGWNILFEQVIFGGLIGYSDAILMINVIVDPAQYPSSGLIRIYYSIILVWSGNSTFICLGRSYSAISF